MECVRCRVLGCKVESWLGTASNRTECEWEERICEGEAICEMKWNVLDVFPSN